MEERLKPVMGLDFSEKNPLRGSFRGWIVLAVALGGIFIVCAIFYVWLYDQQVQNGYHLAKLYQEHEQLLATQRKLRLEWCRFEDPYQLEEMGRNRFGLAPPKTEQKMIMR